MTDKKNNKNIYQKLVEVRKNIKSFKKDATGYGYKYVPGTQILSLIKEDLDKLGIVLETHLLNPIVDKSEKGYLIISNIKMIWIDADNPADKIEISWFMTGEQKDPSQAFGSGLTYTERYFLLKFFGIPTDEDDPDKPPKGNNRIQGKTESDKSKKLVTEKQLNKYHAMVGSAGLDEDEMSKWVKEQYKVEHKKDLNMAQMDDLYKRLDKKIKERKEAEKIDKEYKEAEQEGLL